MSTKFDPEILAEALRSLGLFYGSGSSALAEAARGAADEREAISAYLRRERPHLLACYDLEVLVGLVHARIEQRSEQAPAMESYGPSA